MRKLKRILDGKVYDCTIFLSGVDLMAAYWNGISWTCERLDGFVPAICNVDY